VYLALKTLHILAVVLFLGNIITGVFWKIHGDRTGDPRVMAHTLDGIIRSDRWFTIPGVLLIIVFGLGAAMVAGLPILGTGWIWQSLILFGVSGIAFMAQVALCSGDYGHSLRRVRQGDIGTWQRTGGSRDGGNSGVRWRS
jgi:uncharacterized membrane protein